MTINTPVTGRPGRICTACKIWKPRAEMCSTKLVPDGIGWKCLACERERTRARYHGDLLEQRRKGNIRTKRWQAANMDKVRAYRQKKNLLRSAMRAGIERDDFYGLVEAQDGCCAICGEPCRSGRRLAIDHDHQTGKFRALLCGRCNAGLGSFKDDIARLARAIAYLEEHR